MAGMKRLGQSDSNLDTNDSAFCSKRIMAASPFDDRRAEPSQQHPMAERQLDAHRAASAQQHVRALNTQFASWVQSQMQDHPNELWGDGLQDYLTYASQIREKFHDVVNWLKANAAKAESVSIASHNSEKKAVPEVKSDAIKPLHEKSVFGLAGSTSSFTSSWNSTLLSNNQSPVLFENDIEQPSSPSVKKTEEKGTVAVHEVKCKLFVKSIDPLDKDAWKDKGMGYLSIKCKEGASKATKESKPTIVVRNDVGRVVLNALLYSGIKTILQKNSVVAIFHTSDENGGNNGGNDGVIARTYLMRTKTEEERNKLAAAIQEYAPAS
ncbi:uncharacterized protein LOC122669031 isoform X2 [Telopea speciosissima]|uniref:uncharacterized protein LOC122669031 isoform X2 n=1 Tax=Telopea speciosissima TaxID=54955 RepID=UPI001CC4E03C|nr:uncharacterized protein LOC122669031 isoform X2 [Telopea speciosissima]